MHIEVAVRHHPFSHTPGCSVLIPLSEWAVEVYPTLLRFTTLKGGSAREEIALIGPIADFTVEQDLEKGVVRVFGKGPEGYFRYTLSVRDGFLVLAWEKPKASIKKLFAVDASIALRQRCERLSLGMHRAQNWDLLRSRADMKEIFPLWMHLAQLCPSQKGSKKSVGTLRLLEQCAELIRKGDRVGIEASFRNLFRAGFYSMLVPRLNDEQHQGIVPYEPQLPTDLSPLIILQEGARLVRSLFFQEEGDSFFLLPELPVEFHSGRFVNIQTSKGDLLSLEWSKKLLRRAILRSNCTRTVRLVLQKPLHSFRLRTSLKGRGTIFSHDAPLTVEVGQTFYFDRFQK